MRRATWAEKDAAHEPFRSVFPPRTISCPSCGEEQPQDPGYRAPCLCRRCGARLCEGQIEESIVIDWNAYEEATNATAVYPHANTGSVEELAYIALGLAGECGESVDCIKKIYRGREQQDDKKVQELEEKLHEELGDVLWYLARMTKAMNFNLEELMEANLKKLNIRAEDGELVFRGDK